jgi:hypothetical protein
MDPWTDRDRAVDPTTWLIPQPGDFDADLW